MPPVTHLFLHGGPGFNSFAEEELLGPVFQASGLRAHFWNEPSAQRPAGEPFVAEAAFTGILNSVRKALRDAAAPVSIVAHSFAVHAAVRVAREMPESIRDLTLITPTLDLHRAYLKVLGLAEADLSRLNPSVVPELKRHRDESLSLFDPAMQAAFQIAASDPELILNYWENRARMLEYLEVWGRRGLRLDAPAFFAVLSELRGFAPLAGPVRAPITVIYGEHDRIVDRPAEEARMRALAPKARFEVFGHSGHYPHLEETSRFIAVLRAPLKPRA